jgi:hypothetical protein
VSLIRSVLALLAGIVVAFSLPRLLEGILVQAVAGPDSQAHYFAARNTPGIMAARLIMTFFLSTMAGHMAARIAKEDAVRTVAIAAIALSAMMIWEFTAGEFAWGTPIWMRVALVALTGPPMMLGAIARTKAAEFKETS